MAQEPIRNGHKADDQTRMFLGQVRSVFNPDWIQVFGNGRFTVQFTDDPDAEDELLNFADMYGYEHVKKDGRTWTHYHFE